MSDYLNKEKERWDDSDPDPGEDLIPPMLAAMAPGDVVAEEYYKLVEGGCSIAALMPPDQRAAFANLALLPVWEN